MMKRVALAVLLVTVCSIILVTMITPAGATPTVMSLTVSPTASAVGDKITVTGTGYPPNASLLLEWSSANASWVVTGNPPQVTGTKIVSFEAVIGSVQSNSSGSFVSQIVVPPAFGGEHTLQVYYSNGTALAAKAEYNLEPSFHVSPSSGPAGSPITVTATGLGDGEYSTSYHLYWDDSYVGYMTALSTQGSTNFTIYATGTVGVHYIQIYQGYPGPGYLNPQQGPPSSETQSVFPGLIPYLTEFNITAAQQPAAPRSSTGASGSFGADAIVAAAIVIAAGGPIAFFSSTDPRKRRAVTKMLVAVVIIALLVVGGIVLYAQFGQSQATSPSSSSTTSSSSAATSASASSSSSQSTTNFTPAATVVRPAITVPTNNATSGPRITITPDIAAVGQTITVNGLGFAQNATLPLTWSTRVGNNLHGYQLEDKPLTNVTTSQAGSFSYTMKVPPDLGGLHYIAAGSLTPHSNGTLFLERTCSVSPTEGPLGTPITVACMGVGWDFNTNIIAVDYDNSYFGYGCGFNSGGNVTVTMIATGPTGIQSVDVYPSVWWGTSNYYNQSLVEYRYPLLTPQDHPELMPSFHFTFLITAAGSASSAATLGAYGSIGPSPYSGFALIVGVAGPALVSTGKRLREPTPNEEPSQSRPSAA